MRIDPHEAPARADCTTGFEGTGSARTLRALIVTPTPLCAYPSSGCSERGFAVSTGLTQVEAISKIADGGANPSRPANGAALVCNYLRVTHSAPPTSSPNSDCDSTARCRLAVSNVASVGGRDSRGDAISETSIDEYRRKADRTSPDVTGPMGEAAAKSAPSQVRVLAPVNPTTRPSNKGCIRGVGLLSTAFPSFRLKLRAHRSSAPRVDKDFVSRAVSSPKVEMKPLEWYSYTVEPYKWQEGQA